MWFDAQAELAKLVGKGESDACTPATFATPATQRARVAIVADVAAPRATPATSATPAQRIAPNVASVATYPERMLGPKEAARLSYKALKDLKAATEVANTLLAHLRACDTPEAVFAFLGTYRPAIDALEAHASVRKTHVRNLAAYKLVRWKRSQI